MKKLALFLLMIITVFSCSPLYYVPNSQNVPMMKEKGQTNFTASLGGSGYTNTVELQAAYGLTNKIALQLNGFSARSISDPGNAFKGTGTVLGAGVGYYKKISPVFVYEIYALTDFGTVDNQLANAMFTPDSGNIKTDFFRLGVQPSLSYSRKYFAAAISSRVASLNYYNIHGALLDEVDYLKSNNSYWMLEPAITLQAGFENFKLQFQYVYSINLTDSNFSQDVDHFAVGLIFNINPKK